MSAMMPAKLLEPRRGGLQTDRRAWATLERCRAKLGLAEIPLPIPVDDWIEGPLGIQFGISDLSHLGDGVLGAAFGGGQEILIDEGVLQHEGRFRFTCAHELGHIVLHRQVRDSFQDTKSDVTLSTNRYERQADRFAAAFLMPLPQLEREIVRAFDERRLDRTACTYELMQLSTESEWLWRYRLLPAITRTFNVSLSAAAFRCTQLQPRIRNARPLMPRDLVSRLLVPAESGDPVTAVQVVDGRPQYRDLFSEATEGR